MHSNWQDRTHPLTSALAGLLVVASMLSPIGTTAPWRYLTPAQQPPRPAFGSHSAPHDSIASIVDRRKPTHTPTTTPTPAPTLTNTPTDTPTPAPTSTSTPTNTPTPVPSDTPTNTPTATPTSTPIATPVPIATPTIRPTPTAGIMPTVRPPTPATPRPSRPSRLSLTLRLSPHTVVSGQVFTLDIRATPHSLLRASIAVLVPQVRPGGSRTSSRHPAQPRLLTLLTLRGVTTAQGYVHWRIQLTYAPAQPRTALLTVTATHATLKAVAHLRFTIVPARALPRLPLVVTLESARAGLGTLLVVGVRSAPYAAVRVSVRLTPFRHEAHPFVRTGRSGRADRYGGFVAYLSIGYRPPLPVAASLLVVASSTRGPALLARDSVRIALATAPLRACRTLCIMPVGPAPRAITIDPRTGRVFVANSGNATVGIFNTTTALPDTIRVGEGPEAIALDPASGQVFVVNGLGRSISVLDAATGGLRRTISLGDRPYPAVALAAHAHHLFIIDGYATVAMIDTRTGALRRRVGVGGVLTGLAVDESMGRIYAIDQGGNTLHILDSTTGAPRGIRAIPGLPWAVAVDAVHRRVFLAWASQVSTLDARTLDTRRSVTVGHTPTILLVDPDTARVFVANATDGTVSVLDSGTGRLLRTTAVGALPVALALDPRHGRVYVVNSGSNSASVLDARTGRVLRTLRVGTRPIAVTIDARRGWVYVADKGNDSAGAGGVSMFSTT